jgi:A/G-specific adenine glycosylase
LEKLKLLPGAILPWYEENRRDLPWRRDREPYHVWLSEIMLQQTRVEAVKGYYLRFLEALPAIEDLASCDDDRLNKLWEGLGYYTRAANLKKAAQQIVKVHGGVFPEDYASVRALPGIGDYTAGAICSICFGMPVPAVDGNVLRLIARITDDPTPIDLPQRKEAVRRELEQVYPAQAGEFTQALMELGATLCGPNREPDCANCPCRGFCLGYQRGTARHLPVKLPKRKRREEDRTVLILRCGDRYALEKRSGKGLLAGLWQFPNTEGHLSPGEAAELAANWGTAPRELIRQTDKKHIFTHIQWNMRGYYLEVERMSGDFQWLTAEQVNSSSALPTAFRQFWEETGYV